MRLATATAAASRRWWCKCLGGEESEGEGVGNDGEKRGPFIVAGEGHVGARGERPAVMALTSLKVLSCCRRWRDAVAARLSLGGAGGR
jgi:hypothetical protein